MMRSSLYSFVLSISLTLLVASDYLYAQEAVTASDLPGTNDHQPESASDTAQPGSGVQDVLADSVRSMFQEKESPLLHIRWGTRVYFDLPIGDEPAGASATLRKAELKLSRAFGKNVQVKLSGNYINDEFKAGDSYYVYSGWRRALLTVGVQDPPFSLGASNASSAISFMETALPVEALAENKNAGVDFLKRTPNHLLNASWVFYNPRQQGVSETGHALVARYVYSPIKFHSHENAHLGGSFSYRLLDSTAQVQLRSRPEVATSDVYYVDTGTINEGDSVLRMGLESSQIKGRFSWQAEVLSSRVTRDNAPRADFWGAYFHLSQFLTNDSRNYDQGSGTFINVIPNSPVGNAGWGAFELAFRASYTDLTDKDIIGGRESNLSVGLNWYLNEKFRVMANVVKVLDVDRPGSEYDGLSPLIFALRTQWLIY